MFNPLKEAFQNILISLSHAAWARRFAGKYPGAYAFILRRFELKYFTGFPLTMLVGLLAISVMLFSEIAENVVNSDTMVLIDQRFTLFLFGARNPLLSKALFIITQAASQGGTIAIALLISIALWVKRYKTYVLALWLVLAGVGLSVFYGKLFFHRVRPLEVAYYEVGNFSFPSGHSASAMALFGLLSYFLIRHSSGFRSRAVALAAGVLAILAVGFSRIYLGVHFLSDVAAGYVLGAMWLILGVSLVEWLYYREKPRSE